MADIKTELPPDVRARLAELELELSEGDITEKGYAKKKHKLLAPYISHLSSMPDVQEIASGEADSSPASTNLARRVTREENRFQSDIRTEAVIQALKNHQSKKLPVPMPSKRMSAVHPISAMSGFPAAAAGGSGAAGGAERHPRRESDEDEDDDDDSVFDEANRSASQPSSRTSSFIEHQSLPGSGSGGVGGVDKQLQPLPVASAAGSTPGGAGQLRRSDIGDNRQPNQQPVQPPPPDITMGSAAAAAAADRAAAVLRRQPSPPPSGRGPQSDAGTPSGSTTNNGSGGDSQARSRISAKIQQLVNTLKRPKRRPLPEYFIEENSELEVHAQPPEAAPKPEGTTMRPTDGGQLQVPTSLPRGLVGALQRYGASANYQKASAITSLDVHGRSGNSSTLSYGKLYGRVLKVAYNLLHKLGTKAEPMLHSGDKVAVVYPNNDSAGFTCAFFGCIVAGLVPVPIEVPTSKREAGGSGMGFLLNSLNVTVAMTSEICYKGLPRGPSGDVAPIKGWPRLTWFQTDSLSSPPRDWQPPALSGGAAAADPAAVLYVEHTTAKDGSVMGVSVPHGCALGHCRALTQACAYAEGEVAVCVLDFRRNTGLWHGVLTSVFNGMHVVFVPYSLMKVDPASWLKMITKLKATVALVKSRDMHWGMLAKKDHKDVNLSSLRLLLVADGANPWSLSTCDSFATIFQSRGLDPDVICPCASSSEALTVSLRRPEPVIAPSAYKGSSLTRPGKKSSSQTGRGVLSMLGLSYGVVRVDTDNSLMSLTLQDSGQVLPSSSVVVVKVNGDPYLCKADEVGELCISAGYTGCSYWGLQGLSANVFNVKPLDAAGQPVNDWLYTRTGLIGFLGPGGLVFVCGNREGLMEVEGRRHNTDDVIATVLAVEPNKFIYRGRIAVFSVSVLKDERIVVVAEQRPDCSEEESFQWMSRVLQAVDSIHQVGIYCLALVPPNCLPRTSLGGIHIQESKKKFLDGALHPANILMCPHTCIHNLPPSRELTAEVGPSAMFVGSIVQGARLAEAKGRDLQSFPDEYQDKKQNFLSEMLRWRATTMPDHVIFTCVAAKQSVPVPVTCSQLHKKAERIASLLLEKGKRNVGDHVALVFPPGIELVAAFYGCLYVGCVPVTVRPPHLQNLATTLPTLQRVVETSRASAILTTSAIVRGLRSKEAAAIVDIKFWPVLLDSEDTTRRKPLAVYLPPSVDMVCYLDFSVSTTGTLAGIKVTHASISALCNSIKLQSELYASREVALCLDPYSGLAQVLWVMSSVYSGHNSTLIPPAELEKDPALWLQTLSQCKVRDTFCSYGVMELCTKGLSTSAATLKARGVNLSYVRTCIVVAEERPRIQLVNSFSKVFSTLGLSPRAVSTTFGCRVNVGVCLQGPSCPDPSEIYVDTRALRYDRVSILEKGSPNSLCLKESGKLLPGVKVIIANPDTKGQCADSQLGEIWVSSPHNASGYFALFGENSACSDHFDCRLAVGGDTSVHYARTGCLGFVRRTEKTQADGERHDAIFVVGSLDEAILLRGLRYHPTDIENSILRSHRKVCECAVFTWTNLLVVVAELDGNENEALDVVPLITNIVLEEHHLIVGVVVIVDPGVVPINSRGEKQRMHLRDNFISDELDPIYVAYNM